MYKGSTRKMKISRTIHDGASGKATRVSEVLSIDIKPGWKSGTKVCAACFGCLLTSAEWQPHGIIPELVCQHLVSTYPCTGR